MKLFADEKSCHLHGKSLILTSLVYKLIRCINGCIGMEKSINIGQTHD